MTDPRHRQLSRIYQRPIEDDEDARAAVAAEPGVLASALFFECAESDDVTSVESAESYAADRLEYLRDLVGESTTRVTAEFAARLQAWR